MQDRNELNRWLNRFTRRLDGIPLTKADREDLEELMTIIVNQVQQQVVAPVLPETETTKGKRNGGS